MDSLTRRPIPVEKILQKPKETEKHQATVAQIEVHLCRPQLAPGSGGSDRRSCMPLSQNNIGQSKFPPNPNQWPAERNGLALRAEFGRVIHVPLKPFEIAATIEGMKLLSRAELELIIGQDCARMLVLHDL